jgi:hypothetical protein
MAQLDVFRNPRRGASRSCSMFRVDLIAALDVLFTGV